MVVCCFIICIFAPKINLIDISIIETIVEEQLDELTALADQNFCTRREEKEVNFDSKLT